MTARLWRWGRIFGLSLLALLLGCALAIALLLFTHSGLKVILWGAHKAVPQLQVNASSGALLREFSLQGIRYQDSHKEMLIRVQKLGAKFDLSCFSQPEICLQQLQVQGVSVALAKFPASSSESDTSQSAPLNIPVAVRVANLNIGDVKLNIAGNKLSWQQFSSSLTARNKQITIGKTLWQHVQLTVAKTAPQTTSSAVRHDIQLPDIHLPLGVELTQFELRDFILHQTEPVQIKRFLLKAHAAQQHLDIARLELDMPQGELRLNSDITLKGDYPLRLDSSLTLKQTPLSGQKVHLNASGSVADLNLYAVLTGAVSGTLTTQVNPLRAQLPFQAKLEKLTAYWPLQGDKEYQANVHELDVQGSLSGYKLALQAAFKGRNIPASDVSLLGHGDLNQIDITTFTLQTLAGLVSGSVQAGWEQKIHWQSQLSFNNIQPGKQWPQLPGTLSGQLQTSGAVTAAGDWQVALPSLNIHGTLRHYPLQVKGQLTASASGGVLALNTKQLSLSHGPNYLQVHGKVAKNWQMQVDLHVPQLAYSVPGLQGELSGLVNIAGKMRQPQIDVNLNAHNLDWQKQARLEQAELKGQIQLLSKPQGQLTLTANNLVYQKHNVEQLKVNLHGNEDRHFLTLTLLSDLVNGTLAVNGQLTEKPHAEWRGQLTKMSATTQQGTWNLKNQPHINYDFEQQSANIEANCWTQSKSSICLTKNAFLGKNGEVNLAIQHLDFKQLSVFIPAQTELSGEVNASAKVKWSPAAAPQIFMTMQLPEGRLQQSVASQAAPIVVGWQNSALDVHLEKNQLTAQWQLDLTHNGALSGELTVADVRAPRPHINGNIKANQLELGILQPLLGEYSTFHALLNSDLRLSGSALHPQIHGRLKVNKIGIKGEISPVDVNDGHIELEFKGASSLVNAMFDTPDGKLSANGSADWQNMDKWHSQLHVFSTGLKVDIPPQVQVKVVPDMTIDVTPGLARIDGAISLPWGRIVVNELPTSAISVSKDQVILNKQLKEVKSSDSIPFSIVTDVNVNIGDDFILQAFGLQGGLQGRLHVSEKDKGPFVVGEVNITDGSYRSFGQDLLIQEGKILMNGPVDEPYVSITAVRNPDNTQDDVTAGIKVTGPATNPQVSIFSDPSMPQSNALSYLLRGHDLDSEGGGNMMTTTLIGLSLAKSGKVVGEIGKAVGVSDLQLDTAGSGDESQVTVSGYILPGLQVKYGVGIFNSLGEFTVRYRLMKSLYIEAVSGIDSAVDLLYQFEFD